MLDFRERACRKLKQTREESAAENGQAHGNGEKQRQLQAIGIKNQEVLSSREEGELCFLDGDLLCSQRSSL